MSSHEGHCQQGYYNIDIEFRVMKVIVNRKLKYIDIETRVMKVIVHRDIITLILKLESLRSWSTESEIHWY